jgi:hypothetical protein
MSLLIPLSAHCQFAEASHYLDSIKHEPTIQWPKIRSINLVFHRHSVPAGYGDSHEVNTLQSYTWNRPASPVPAVEGLRLLGLLVCCVTFVIFGNWSVFTRLFTESCYAGSLAATS